MSRYPNVSFRRLARVGLILVILSGTSSCALLFGSLFAPKIVMSVGLVDSDSQYGFFTVAVNVENSGGGSAQNLDYELFILGSNGSPIAYELWEDKSDLPTAVGSRSTRLASFMGQGTTYVPYSFDLYVYYEDTNGNVLGPANVSGELHPD